MQNQNFESAKEKIILQAENKAYTYLLNKYAHAKIKSSDASLEITEGPVSGTSVANGRIRCFASTPVLNHEIEVGMTVNNNDVSVESETPVEANIVKALNASEDYLPTEDVVTASLSEFRLIDSGDNKYLKVAHPALEDAEIGTVGKAEYSASPNKAELLKSIVSDSLARTASYNYSINFVGSFVEPKIEKYSSLEPIEKKATLKEEDKCLLCKEAPRQHGEDNCSLCEEKLQEKRKENKKSWLTADLDTEEYVESENTISMDNSLPLARMSGGVEQSMQAEQQKLAAEKDKLSNQAVNQLIPTLQSLGYGSSKVSEITPELTHSDNGFNGTITAMTFVDDKNSVKLVAFPIKIKASQIELPKLPLVKELISKAIDINEKLTEQLTKEALLKISEIDEKVSYEKNEVESILKDENKIEKTATENGLSGVQLVGPQDTITLQKHLLPIGAEDLAIGDKIFGDGHYWQLVDKEGMQNDKNSESSSLWKFVKCEPPKEKEEPAVRISE